MATNAVYLASLVNSSGNNVTLQGGVVGSGTGVAFPATQVASSDANTLDDYEEGTWTPGISGASVANAVGIYTKVGRLVEFQARIQWNSISGTTNVLTGLPFTAISNGTEASLSMCVTPYVNNGFGSIPGGYGYLNGYVGSGSSVINFTWQPNTTAANFSTGSGNIYISGYYTSA